MLIDSYNVHLLKPVVIKDMSIDTTSGITLNQFQKNKMAVINYYLTSNKRQALIQLFAKEYLPAMKKVGIENIMLWMYEAAFNDYQPQHVYQDRNQLMTIIYFDNAADYHKKMAELNIAIRGSLATHLEEIIVANHTQILYPKTGL